MLFKESLVEEANMTNQEFAKSLLNINFEQYMRNNNNVQQRRDTNRRNNLITTNITNLLILKDNY